MRLGIHLPHIGRKAGPEAIRRAAVQAEQLGFADVWVSEHIIVPRDAPYPPSAVFWDPVLTLTWAAAYTQRVGLGTSVLVLPMRHPLPPVAAPDDLCVRDMDEAMTEDQAEHLRILCEEAGEDFDPTLHRDEAERQIRRLQHKAGYKP